MLFRSADSPVNAQAVSVSEEEENEDLRPTQTTIQYKTVGVDVSKNGKIENVAGSKKRALGKKEIIIIAAVAAFRIDNSKFRAYQQYKSRLKQFTVVAYNRSRSIYRN